MLTGGILADSARNAGGLVKILSESKAVGDGVWLVLRLWSCRVTKAGVIGGALGHDFRRSDLETRPARHRPPISAYRFPRLSPTSFIFDVQIPPECSTPPATRRRSSALNCLSHRQ